MHKDKHLYKAFTLIELLVVISIIGLIAALVVVSVRKSTEQARTAGGMEQYSGVKKALSADAVGFWSFDNDNANDDSGSNNFSSITMGAGVSAVNGIIRRAMSFNGGGYISANFSSSYTLINSTYSAWINAANTSSWRLIIDSSSGISYYQQMFAVLNGSFTIYGRCGYVTGITPIKTNTWYYVVWTVSGTNYKVYVNGVEVKSGNGCSASVSITNMYIGGGGCCNFLGVIDEVGVYNKSLSGTEIRNNYYAGLLKHNNLVIK